MVIGEDANGGARCVNAAGHSDLNMNPFADAVVGGETLNLRSEALLGLYRHNLRASQRGPHGEEPAVSTKIDDPTISGHRQPAAEVDIRQYISRAPAV